MSRHKTIEQAAQAIVDMDDCGLIVWENGITGINAINALRKAIAMPKDDAERLALLERLDNDLSENGWFNPHGDLLLDIRAYLKGGER